MRYQPLFTYLRPFRLFAVALTVFSLVVCHACAQAPVTIGSAWQLQSAAAVADTGNAISQPAYSPAGWYAATVPGTVLGTLVKAGVYPDPLYGTNNLNIPDALCLTSYWYRVNFTVPSSYAGKRIWLNFKGINYSATVWVNGNNLGSIQGAFTRGVFDITSMASVGGLNGLAVLMQPEPNPGASHQKTIASGTGKNGGVTATDGPTFLCSIGWDWIPTIRDRDTGIWQDVFLSASGPVAIQNPYVTSTVALPGLGSADLTLQTTLSNATSTAQTGVLTGVIDGTNSFSQSVSVAANGAQKVTFAVSNTPSLHIVNPALWWPNGYGAPNLHTLALNFAIGGSISDTQNVTFGIRKMSYNLSGSTNLALVVNGVPVAAKGGNWGMDEAMKRIPDSRLEAQIQMHQQANYTIIRNWVGQSTAEDFYSLCDQYGIMVWDEFFQPNPNDGPDPANTTLYLANVQEKLLRFRNHPSIALWCGRNEGNPSPTAVATGNSNLVATLDPSRLYQANSSAGAGVASGGPYHWQTPRSWYSVDAAFKTEIGSISVPTLEAVQAMMPSNDWAIVNDDWAEHDFCSGAQQGNLYPGLITSRYGAISSLGDFVRKSQLMNYECFRAIYEGRFAKLFNPVTGVITWMSNPAQPSFVWQLYSHDLEPNASLFAVRKACEPIHIELNQSTWHLHVINNSAQTLSGLTASVQVYNLDGSSGYSQTFPANPSPSAAVDLGLIAFPSNLSAVHFVKLRLFDAQNQVISENFYWRETVTDNFQALDALPMVTLGVQTAKQVVGTNCVISVSLTNPAVTVALMAHLQLRRAQSGQRVLPVFYSDNYVSLLPGETRAVTVTFATNNLSGDAPVLALDGWNVTAQPSPAIGNGIAVTNNPGAQANSGPANNIARINCGGTASGFVQFGPPYYSGFAADANFSGGTVATTTNSVDVTASNAAPGTVYQSERWGAYNYTIPLSLLTTYAVRLHFAETKFTTPGGRVFNVAINGQQVLTNFDIFAAAGTSNKAVVRDFAGILPNSGGAIVISTSIGTADNPKICGIEVFPAPTQQPTITMQPANQALSAGATATFTVGIVGANPLTCRWQCNGTNLMDAGRVTGSASTNLTRSGITFSDAGSYRCIASNSFGSVTSAAATLAVLQPFNSGSYAYRMKIAFPGYARSETLSNFPALVTVSTNLAGFSYRQFASAQGNDLRFTDGGGLTAIPFEIDEWDTNGTSRVWVRVPQLTNGTSFVWAFWGNPADAQPLPSMTNGTVWSSDHLLVWHLKESTFPYTDSAAQFPAVTGVNPVRVDSLIGQGELFYGTTNFLDAGTAGLSQGITLSAWFNLATGATNIQTLWANKPGGSTANGFAVFVNSYRTADASIRLETGNGTSGTTAYTPGNTVSFGQWHLLSTTIDSVANVARIYLDGIDVTSSGNVYSGFGRANDLNLGRFPDGNYYFTGMLEEARIASTIQSANWIWASWLNVASNGTFVTYSAINPAPLLTARNSGGSLLLSWPQSAGPFTLYATTNLSTAASWLAVPGAPVLTNGQWQLSVASAENNRFYRLQQ